MKYKVLTTAIATFEIFVYAESKQDAIDKVFDGEYDPKYDEPVSYGNEEVLAVWEVKGESSIG